MGFPQAKTEMIEVLSAEHEVPEDVASAIEIAKAALNYVANNTYCGHDAEWHLKKGYDPQAILNALSWYSSVSDTHLRGEK